ncbi:hypothetical protein ZHAS_00013418 [Anopheles sinensis]|uniref:Uncharacterized protein n=1 Tax=Anopheles sinensis TaxID=74873 RepID=A0A084W5J1_ANOSI|nr:hypothetical protein ZHAS_00013418 [Anopheles sinensis]
MKRTEKGYCASEKMRLNCVPLRSKRPKFAGGIGASNIGSIGVIGLHLLLILHANEGN